MLGVMLRAATFNVFWFGASASEKTVRGPGDELLLGDVVRRLDADFVVFQEIVAVERLESLLAQGPGRRWSLRDEAGRIVTSADPQSERFPTDLKIVLGYDPDVLEVVRFSPLRYRGAPAGTRRALIAHLRHRMSGWGLTAVGVHFKSGPLGAGLEDRAAQKRAAECRALAAWLSGHEPSQLGPLARPPTDDVVVMGDFNARRDHWSLHRLREGPLATWTWHEPRFPDQPGEAWTSWLERAVIDHVITSPSLTARIAEPPAVYAFDLDPTFDRPPPEGPGYLRRHTDIRISPWPGAPCAIVPDLYRVSDHRPVHVAFHPPP